MNDPKSDTLFAGRTVTVIYDDDSSEDVLLRQLPLREYERAFGLLADELALTAFFCGRDKQWLFGATAAATAAVPQRAPTPASFEVLRRVAAEVNESFFAWSARRQQQEAAAQKTMIEALANLPAEAVEQVIKLGWASISPTSSGTSSPRRN